MRFAFFLLSFLSIFQLAKAGGEPYLDYPLIWLNYQRSIHSNYINSEFQLGNSDEMHFITLTTGIHTSNYSDDFYTPYYTGTTEVNSLYAYNGYSSKKFGFQVGAGYCYYFKNLENKEEIIPFFSQKLFWMRTRDEYVHSYTNTVFYDVYSENKTAIFHTLCSETSFGITYGLTHLFFNARLNIAYYLPVNTTVYMATDKYNTRSGRKLPMVGFEPSLEIAIGLKL